MLMILLEMRVERALSSMLVIMIVDRTDMASMMQSLENSGGVKDWPFFSADSINNTPLQKVFSSIS